MLLLLTAGSWPDTVTTLDLSFDPDQWAYAYEHFWEDIWLEGNLDTDQGTFLVTFRIRGQSSRTFPKKSLKVEIHDGELYGYTELNLNAQYLDISRIRECLSYEYNRYAGLTVPETGLVELLFNGETQGPYLFVQDVDGDFAESTILPDDAVIYKARLYGSSLNRTENLHYYVKKTYSGDPADDLELLIAWLVNSPDSMFLADLGSRIHLDQLTTLVAVNVLIAHGSTYYHNYHAVLDSPGETGRWRIITWDMDRTWGRSYGADWPYYYCSNGSNYPNTLIWRSWCQPVLRQLFLDRVWSLSDGFVAFAGSGIIDSLSAAVEPLVEVDPYRDYTMDEFHAEVDIIRNWPATRLTHLGLMADWPLPFHMIGVTEQGGIRNFSWTSAGPGCTYTLGISADSSFKDPDLLVFEAVTADTSYVLSGWTPPAPPEELYWTVTADNGQKSEKARDWFMPLVPAPSHRWDGQVVINEVCYAPCPGYPSGDWVELLNTSTDTLSLIGWSFRDGNDRHLHTLGVDCLPPDRMVIVYSDSLLFRSLYPECPADDDAFDFRLSGMGETLRLYDLSGRLVDRVAYLPGDPWPELGVDETLALIDPYMDNSDPLSWAASPEGGTPGLPNDSLAGGNHAGGIIAGNAFPSPCGGSFSIDVSVPYAGKADLGIYDLSGRMVLPVREIDLVPGEQELSVFTKGLPSGIYYILLRYRGSSATARVVILGI
jgi:hypothetical protein